MPREEIRKGTERERKHCSACGCITWLRCAMTGQYLGPYHFADCPSVPGGAELRVANSEQHIRWLEESYVPREQAARMLQAILAMMRAPSRTVMLEMKTAILGELAAYEVKAGR